MSTQPPETVPPIFELFIDGHCAACTRFGAMVSRLDKSGDIELHSFRHDRQHVLRGLSDDLLLKRMHIYSRATGATCAGFEAILVLCRALPALKPLVPVLQLLKVLRLGAPLYDFLAKHRMLVPSPSRCVDGVCMVANAPKQDKERWTRRGLSATALVLGLLLVAHFLATLVHVMPLSSIGVFWGGVANRYIQPIFSQRWSLFAPEPPQQNTRLNIQCRGANGSETPWLDTDAELAKEHAKYRLTPSAYLLRLNRAAIAGAVGVHDSVVDELVNKADTLSKEEQSSLRTTLLETALGRLNEQRFLYRVSEHYCERAGIGPVTATRVRVLFETAQHLS